MTDLVAARRPFVDGCWISGGAAEFAVHSPATLEQVAAVEGATPAQTEAAILAARTAFDTGGWPLLPREQRIAAVLRLADALDARRDVLVETVIQETGCPRALTELVGVGMALRSVRELADLYGRMPEREYNEVPFADHMVGSSVRVSTRRYEPAGVVAAITPYNFPLVTNVWKAVAALLAGCTVVLRPNPLTPLEATVFGEAALEADLPPGVLNVVTEAGTAGAVLLTTHPAVDTVSFTGSVAVGRAVAAQAAPTLKRVILELGGKSVQLHLPDVFDGGDLSPVVAAAMPVFISNAGQACAVTSRMLVPQERRAEVLDAVSAAAAALRVGDPTDPATQVGPLITQAQRDRVHAIVQASARAGARVTTGGRVPDGLDRGWYYAPTVIDAPSPDNPAAREEVFGPVITVLGYRDVEDAIRITNDHELGLAFSVYTDDLALGSAIADRIRAGTVQVNANWASAYTPMGGYKQSGYGRERGVPGIRAFQELKHVVIGGR
jgi:acyl-CoA reductase-like NAD-dependent aldehyde dehydrogenase